MRDHREVALAAKVAGYEAWWNKAQDSFFWDIVPPVVNGKEWKPWSDNAQAFDLAEKLNLLVDFCGMCVRPTDDSIDWVEGVGDDPQEKVRDAIFKCAIAMGRLKCMS